MSVNTIMMIISGAGFLAALAWMARDMIRDYRKRAAEFDAMLQKIKDEDK